MPRLRKLVFYFFLLFYLVACPWTVLYALGYIFKPIPQPELVETGLIHLATIPSGASVYLNGKLFTQTTPTALRELQPGAYRIRLARKGYRPWERTLRVEAEQAHLLEKILLLPKESKEHALFQERWDRMIPVLRTPYLLLTKGPSLGEVFLYDLETLTGRPLLPEASPFREGRVNSIRTTPGSSQLLFKIRTREGSQWLRIDLGKKVPEPEDLTVLFPREPQEVAWAPEGPDRLFVLRKGGLDRLELEDLAVYPNIAEEVRGLAAISAKELVLLSGSGTLRRVRYDGEPLETLLGNPEKGRSLFGETDLFSIHLLEENLFLFLGEQGELITNRLPYRLAEKGIRGFQWDRKSKRLLVWTRNQLGLADFSSSHKGDELFERGPSLAWVFEQGKEIKQAFWVHEGSHVLFLDRGQVFLLEVETSSNPALGWSLDNALHRLVEVAPNSSVFYSEESGKLFYLDRRQRRLISTAVVPTEENSP